MVYVDKGKHSGDTVNRREMLATMPRLTDSPVSMLTGRLTQQRSNWSLKFISDAFWAVLNAIMFL